MNIPRRPPSELERRRQRRGRRTWDLPPRLTAVLVAWAAIAPALAVVLDRWTD